MRAAAIALVLALTLPLTGCDLLKKLSNEKVMAATLIETPSVPGFTQVSPHTPQIPGVVLTSVFFGNRAGDGSSVTGLGGATVNLIWTDTATHTVPLADLGSGNYVADSVTTNTLVYLPGVTYTFDVQYGGDHYTGHVEAPRPAGIQEFDALTAPLIVDSYAGFPADVNGATSDTVWTIHRTDGGGGGSMAFYAVYTLPMAGGTLDGATPTCDNAPVTANDWLHLVLEPGPWQQASFGLTKADCFPQPDPYVVGLTNLKQGGVSDNLFYLSAVVAGTTDAGVVVLQP